MLEVLRAALEMQRFMEERRWRFAFIGGLANMAWGIVRTTQDAHITLFTGFIDEQDFVSEVLAHFRPRIPDALKFALQARVVLVFASNGIGVDIGLGGFPFEEEAVDRATVFDLGDEFLLRTISAEDLIAMKSFAGRDQDWADVEGVARRQGPNLGWNYVLSQAAALAEVKEDESIIPRLLQVRARWNH